MRYWVPGNDNMIIDYPGTVPYCRTVVEGQIYKPSTHSSLLVYEYIVHSLVHSSLHRALTFGIQYGISALRISADLSTSESYTRVHYLRSQDLVIKTYDTVLD